MKVNTMYLNAEETAAACGVSRETFYRRLRWAKGFPQPIFKDRRLWWSAKAVAAHARKA